MKIYADCADLRVMKDIADQVTGFTTNPTLMRAAGVTDYERFGRECVEAFPDHSLSFEVIANDLPTMRAQASKIASWGKGVLVKIPISLTDGSTTVGLIHTLSHEGISPNVTAVFTPLQVLSVIDALWDAPQSIISIFAGRIADTGVDPVSVIDRIRGCVPRHIEVLWASAREVLNVYQARHCGCDIITLTPDLIKKYYALQHKDLTEFSRDTVQMFYDDASVAGLSI